MIKKNTLTSEALIFKLKFLLWLSCCCLLSLGIAVFPYPQSLAFQVFLGMMFAHGVELAHEIGHHNHFSVSWINRWCGFCLAAPFLISHTQYKISHGHHHKYVGTPDDEESFGYDFQSLQTFFGLLFHLSMLNHYCMAISRIIRSFSDKEKSPVGSSEVVCKIRLEYRLIGFSIMLVLALSWYLHSALIVSHWLIPLIFFAAPVHALIELPEHIGCQKDSSDILLNTRTITAGAFMEWFTNGNCWHVEHHISPKTPVHQLREMHEKNTKAQIKYLESSYWSFYRKVMWEVMNSEKNRIYSLCKSLFKACNV